MKSKTIQLEHCVEHVYVELYQYTHVLVRNLNILGLFYTKIVLLINAMLQILCTKFMIKVLLYELIAYALDNIVYAALHEK